jgi:hypothetical protein
MRRLVLFAVVTLTSALACGESLIVNNDGGGSSPIDGSPLVADGQAPPEGAVDPEGGRDSGGEPINKFACTGDVKDVFCTTFDETGDPLALWTQKGTGVMIDTQLAAVSPTHSLRTNAASGVVSTVNKDIPIAMFGASPHSFEAEFEFYPTATEDGLVARIVTLSVSKKGTGSAGDAVYRIEATLKPGGAAFAMKIVTQSQMANLVDAPSGKWSKLRLTATETTGGNQWMVKAEFLNGSMDTRLVTVTTPATTVAYSLEVGADRGGIVGSGSVTINYDNVRVRNLK